MRRRTGVCRRPRRFLALRGEEEVKVPMQEACFRKSGGGGAGRGTEAGLERCHSLACSQCLRFWRGKRITNSHCITHPERKWALPPGSSQACDGNLFPSIMYSCPSLSSSAQCSQVNERLCNDAIPCTGMPSTVRGAAKLRPHPPRSS